MPSFEFNIVSKTGEVHPGSLVGTQIARTQPIPGSIFEGTQDVFGYKVWYTFIAPENWNTYSGVIVLHGRSSISFSVISSEGWRWRWLALGVSLIFFIIDPFDLNCIKVSTTSVDSKIILFPFTRESNYIFVPSKPFIEDCLSRVSESNSLTFTKTFCRASKPRLRPYSIFVALRIVENIMGVSQGQRWIVRLSGR